MNHAKQTTILLRNSVLFLLVLTVASLSWGQKKTSAPAPSKPSAPAPRPAAPKPAAPAHTAAAPHTSTAPHGTTPSHNATTPGHTTAGAHTTAPGHGTTTGHTTTPGHTTPAAGHGAPVGHGTPAGHGTPSRAAQNHTPPGKVVSLKGGGQASIRPSGKIRSIDRGGMHIEHGLHGGRRVVSEHNGARVVTTGAHRGYVQRPYVTRNGHTYVQRTTVINNVSYTSVYRGYNYGGAYYYGYSPAYYYNPGFYGWAYNPWPAPISYGWGWGGSPWYGYYGGYFQPYPVYPTAALWLTDYLIAANLQAAYAARAEANAGGSGAGQGDAAGGGDQGGDQGGGGDQAAAGGGSGSVALTPEVKQAIAEEVKAQLAAEKAAASTTGASSGGQPPTPSSGEVPPALDPARRTFIVYTDLDVTADGQECALTGGDVITRIGDTPDDDKKVAVSVSSSKKNDCAAGKQVLVSVDDLQEMHNHFAEQLDGGMKSLAEKQGTGNIPKAPDTKTVASEVPPPATDTSAAKALADQQATADQTEAQVAKEALSQGS